MMIIQLGKKQPSGFSLVELLVVLVIFGLVVGMAIADFSDSVANNRNQTGALAMKKAIIQMRTQAVNESKKVIMCPTTDGNTCTDDWSTGWMYFVDGDFDDNFQTPASDRLVYMEIYNLPIGLDTAGGTKIIMEPTGLLTNTQSFYICNDPQKPLFDVTRTGSFDLYQANLVDKCE